MDITKDIRKICIDKDISLSTLAERTGQSIANLSNKMGKGNFTIKQLEDIASALDCVLWIEFIDKPTPKDENKIE